MNLKPNLWTLLFLITAVALYYVVSIKEIKGASDPMKVSKIKSSTKITAEDFQNRYTKYVNQYLSVVSNPALKLDSLTRVDNLHVTYYRLAATQLDSIYESYRRKGKPRVFIYPGLKQVSDDSTSLDLIFAMSDSLGGGTEYFDFTRPCPTVCDTDMVVPVTPKMVSSCHILCPNG